MAFLKPDGTPVDYNDECFFATGSNGILLRQGAAAAHVLKIPKIRNTFNATGDDLKLLQHYNSVNHKTLENEKAVYRRIRSCPGVLECVEISEKGILMPYLRRGDLESFIADTAAEPAEESKKAAWIDSIITTILHVHDARVLLDDIALRNILLDEDFATKVIDFGQCAIFPMDTHISEANDDGCTVQTDIVHLGCVIYSIAAWAKFEWDLFERQFARPAPEDTPDVDSLFCGDVIRKCWGRGYALMEDVWKDWHRSRPSSGITTNVLL